MNKKLLALGLISCGAAVPTYGAANADLRVGMTVDSAYATELDGDGSHKAELLLEPEFEARVGDVRVTGILRVRGDLYDRLEPGQPHDPNRSGYSERNFQTDQVESELRELYADFSIGSSYVRLGKQQVVWGQADGLKVLDLVNPQSFREFILDAFEDSRIPLWTANWEIPIRDVNVQLLWIPDTTYNDLPTGVFAFTSPEVVPAAPPPTVPVTFAALDRPSGIGDSDAGLKVSTFAAGWDLSLNYLFHYYDNPVIRRQIGPGGVVVNTGYERTHTIGGTVNNAFGDYTFRGELGFNTERYFLASNPADDDGVVKTSELSYVIGLDWSGISDTLFSGQVFQSVVDEPSANMTRKSLRTDLTFLAQRQFMNETFELGLIVIHNYETGDGVVRPGFAWDYQDNIKFIGGLDIFYGPTRGVFGQYDERDRVLIGVEIGL